MAKVLLKFKDTIIEEFPLGSSPLTIGRTEDNVVPIDNLGVSRHHAQIVQSKDEFFIEDLGSQNGTVVNSLPIKRCALRDRDQIAIGKHVLIFLENDDTVLDQYKAIEPTQRRKIPSAMKDLPPEETLKIGGHKSINTIKREKESSSGYIKVMEGAATPEEAPLEKVLFIVGRGSNADLTIEGDYSPDVIFIISSRPTGFFLSPSNNVHLTIDDVAITEVIQLKENSVIQFNDVKMKFYYR